MTAKRITARSVNGNPDRYILIKPNESDGGHALYISAPKFFLLDETAVYELADTLVDLIES